MATWGVKVSDDLKDKLTATMRDSKLEGEEFAEQLLTLYVTEIMKRDKPAIAQELEELQRLTQRIYAIYLNSSERTDNMIQSKVESFESTLSEKQKELIDINNNLNTRELEFEGLTEAFNNLAKDKKEVMDLLKEKQDTINTKQELIDEYKGKIDTLSGILEEYKQYKEHYDTLHKSHQVIEKNLGDTVLQLKEKASELNQLTQQGIFIEKQYKDKIDDMIANHEIEINNLDTKHKDEIQNINEKTELKVGKAILELQQQHQTSTSELRDKYNNMIGELQQRVSADNEKIQKLFEDNKSSSDKKKETNTNEKKQK